MTTKITISIPIWLDLIFAWPVLLYRLWKYGYAYRRIYLGEGRFALVDSLDFYRLNVFHWYAEIKGNLLYAARNVIAADSKKIIFAMHREIMNFPANLLVDHRNGDTLDNRRDNLRIATWAQNNYNRRKTKSKTSSHFIGVSFHKLDKRWCANIRHNKKEFGSAASSPKSTPPAHTTLPPLNITANLRSSIIRRKLSGVPSVSICVSQIGWGPGLTSLKLLLRPA